MGVCQPVTSKWQGLSGRQPHPPFTTCTPQGRTFSGGPSGCLGALERPFWASSDSGAENRIGGPLERADVDTWRSALFIAHVLVHSLFILLIT